MKRHQQGMSLLEATIVLGVTAILTTLAINSMGTLQENGEVAGASNNMLLLLRKARTMALLTGVRQGVYIGGMNDSTNNGSNGPDLRNRLVHFRKSDIGSTSTDLEATDRILSTHEMPMVKVGKGEPPRSKIQFRLLQSNPQGSIRIVFDEEGRPTISLATTGGSTVQSFTNNGTGPFYFFLRSTQRRDSMPFDEDGTRRCFSLDPSGEVRAGRVPMQAPFDVCLPPVED